MGPGSAAMPLPVPGCPRLGPALALALLLLGPARPISFQLPGKARKCLREEIHRDTLVTGEYEIGAPPGAASGPSANLKVRGAAGAQSDRGRGARSSVPVGRVPEGERFPGSGRACSGRGAA